MNKRATILLSALLTCSVATSANANFKGKDLLEFCTPIVKDNDRESLGSGICLGFIHASIQAPPQNLYQLSQSNKDPRLLSALGTVEQANLKFICQPEQVTRIDVIKSFVEYLEAKPFLLQQDAALLLYKHLSSMYPCITSKVPSIPEE